MSLSRSPGGGCRLRVPGPPSGPVPRPAGRVQEVGMPRRIGFGTFSETFSGGDYTADEWEFIRAVAAYQKRWNRRYPTWRELLHIAYSLGYRKVADPTPINN